MICTRLSFCPLPVSPSPRLPLCIFPRFFRHIGLDQLRLHDGGVAETDAEALDQAVELGLAGIVLVLQQ